MHRRYQIGMRWTIARNDVRITLLALYLTPSRWDHCWTQHNKLLPDSL